jgi:hypothetical protein
MVAELRDYLNLRYDGEATVATEIGVESSSLADWLVGESSVGRKDTVAEIRDFLKRKWGGLA